MIKETFSPFGESVLLAPIPTISNGTQEKALDIAAPSLCTQHLELLPAALSDEQLQEMLGSQGFFESSDGSFAYAHVSSTSLAFFLYEKKEYENLPCRVNMDRGGVLTRSDGSHVVCIADGASGDGYFSAFVAQMVCEYMLRTLSKTAMSFTSSQKWNKTVAQQLFTGCAQDIGKRIPSTLDGSSTVLVAECIPQNNGKYLLQVAALGDGAVFHINSSMREVKQLNVIQRECKEGKPDVEDTGGLICSKGFAYALEKSSVSVSEIAEEDLVVVVTDGFIDNVRDGRVEEMVQFVAFNPFFDQSFDILEQLYTKMNNCFDCCYLPSIEELKCFIENCGGTLEATDERLTAKQITKRLENYIHLATCVATEEEEKCYRWEMYGGEEPVLSENKDHSPKTDDYMIITMSPCSVDQ